MKRFKYILFALIWICSFFPRSGSVANAQRLNDKLLNCPYADLRQWHLGFSVGLHTQDIRFTHNGFITPEGESWFMEQPSFQPGFNVNGLFDMRLNDFFNVRSATATSVLRKPTPAKCSDKASNQHISYSQST